MDFYEDRDRSGYTFEQREGYQRLRLEFGTGFKRDIRLHRENRVRSIHSSLAIEGNTLSLGEVTAVLQGKVVAGRQSEIKEVKNAYEAYDEIMAFDPYSISDFCGHIS